MSRFGQKRGPLEEKKLRTGQVTAMGRKQTFPNSLIDGAVAHL